MEYRRQHYFPPAYLQFFSLHPAGRESRLWIYDGNIHREVSVDTIGAEDFCYATERREVVETWFSANIEGPYAHVIRGILRRGGCSKGAAMTVFRFGIMLKFRSPAYRLPGKMERFDALEEITFTALRGAFATVPDCGFTSAAHFDQTVLKEMDVRIIVTPDALAISDNPVLIFQEPNGQLWEAVIIPITYQRIMVFYRPDRLQCSDSISSADLDQYFLAMRDCRFGQFIFLPVQWDGIPMGKRIPEPLHVQEVTATTVSHHFQRLPPHGFPPLSYLPNTLRSASSPAG